MKKLIFICLISITFKGISQNKIELTPTDCNSKNGFTAFLLDRAKPKILTNQKTEKIEKFLEDDKMIILNNSDSLKIRYTNIFKQTIDTTFKNAKELKKINICVNKFKDYRKKSIIKESILNRKNWILNSTWGHGTYNYDKLILKPLRKVLKYKYYKNGKKVKTGRIKITERIVEKISLFERKLNLMKNEDGLCDFSHSYSLTNGIETIKLQDDSCSGFSNEQLLRQLNIIK